MKQHLGCRVLTRAAGLGEQTYQFLRRKRGHVGLYPLHVIERQLVLAIDGLGEKLGNPSPSVCRRPFVADLVWIVLRNHFLIGGYDESSLGIELVWQLRCPDTL